MLHRVKNKIHIKKDAKFNRSALLITVLAFGVLGTIIIGLSRAATPSSGFTNVVNDPIDPLYLKQVPFGARSDYIQVWRSYMDTVPAPVLLDAVGVNFNVSGNTIEPTARLLAANGFKRVRVEFSWGGMDYDNPTQLNAATQAKVQQYIGTFKKYGLRPLIVLNANDGGPTPVKGFQFTVTQPAKAGDHVIHIDPAVIPQIIPNYSGSKFNESRTPQAKYRFTTITPDGTVTLSTPLKADVAVGTYNTGATQRFLPFFPATNDSGQPSPEFNETMKGWIDYVGATTRSVKQAWGSDNFDVEIWNELSFGSAFISYLNYYSPPPAGYTKDSNAIQNITINTISYIRNPANGVTNIQIGNGFTNQSPWGSGVNQPVGIDAIDKHPYSGPIYSPFQGQGSTPIDATGVADPTAYRQCVLTYDHTKPASYTDTNANGKYDINEPCTGDAGVFSPKEPHYNQIMPEAFLNASRGTETIIRDLAPFDNPIQGGPHGRNTKACATCKPPVLWITEVNLPSYSGTSKPGSDGKYIFTARTPEEAWHIATKDYLRYLVAWVNKGAKVIDFYAANADNFSVIHPSFFDLLTANNIKQNPTYYPGDNSGGPSVDAIKNLTDIMKQAAAPITQPRQLTLTKIADNHNHMQFDTTDGTPGHPPLYDRDVLAVLPFQVSNSRFAIPAYVMTRDVTTIYNPNAAADGSKYDMPPEAFQMTLGGLDTGKTYSASAIDPLTNASTPVSIVSQGAGTAVVQADLTDSPRVIILAENGASSVSAPPDTTPPDTLITIPPSGSRADPNVLFAFTSNENNITFQCQIDGGPFTACTSPKEYNLAVGAHSFAFRAIDAAGNVDPTPATANWTITAPVTTGDTTAPNTSISPTSVATLGGSSASFSFTSGEGGTTFECKLDTATYSPCTSPKTYSNLLAGFHTFSVRAIDAAGNTDATPASYTWLASNSVSDTTDPSVSITAPVNGSSVSGVVTSTATATDNMGVTRVDFALDGSFKISDSSTPYNYSFDSKTLSNGNHTITAIAYDAAGNSSSTTVTALALKPVGIVGAVVSATLGVVMVLLVELADTLPAPSTDWTV